MLVHYDPILVRVHSDLQAGLQQGRQVHSHKHCHCKAEPERMCLCSNQPAGITV